MEVENSHRPKIEDAPQPYKGRILVVEDYYNTRAFLHYNLRKEGYDVQAIDNADQVFEVIEEWQPELILLDIMLPGSRLSTVELCERLRNSPRTSNIVIILVSGLTQECLSSPEEIRVSLGADDYFTKPFDIDQLLTRVGSYFNS